MHIWAANQYVNQVTLFKFRKQSFKIHQIPKFYQKFMFWKVQSWVHNMIYLPERNIHQNELVKTAWTKTCKSFVFHQSKVFRNKFLPVWWYFLVKVHFLDLRNHGGSPHTDQHSYSLMIEDVLEYVANKVSPIASKLAILGHSIGRKVAFDACLQKVAFQRVNFRINPKFKTSNFGYDFSPIYFPQ